MAGGGAPTPSSSGGRRTVDFQLNMIPMIDLLSVLISFLLMTAVWTQVSRIDVKQEPTPCCDGPDVPHPLEKVAIVIKKSGYSIGIGSESTEIEKRDARYDYAQLRQKLAALSAPGRRVSIATEDDIAYEELIRVMDLCLEHGLDRIGVTGIDT